MRSALFAIAVCAATSLAPAAATSAETTEHGWIVMSVAGCAHDSPVIAKFLIKREHPYKSFRVSASANNPFFHLDFKASPAKGDAGPVPHQDNCGPNGITGQVLVFEAPAGVYEIDRLSVLGWSSFSHARNPIEPFEVTPGRTSYIGEVFVPGGLDIAAKFFEREQLLVSDQSARDMPIAKTKNANVAALSDGDDMADPHTVRVRQ